MADRLLGDRFARLPAEIVLRALISVTLAVVLWSWVTTQRDPVETRSFNELPLQEPQLPDPLEIAGEFGTVSVRLEGPRSALDGLLRSDLAPYLDLSGVDGPGSYDVPVRVDVPGAVGVDRITPSRLSIIVDRRASRSVHLEVLRRQPEDGTRRIGNVVPQVSEVTVTGPQGLVDDVARVVLPIEIGDRTDDFTAQFQAVAVGGNGQPIPEVDVRPRRIEAQVSVETRGRSVPVLIQTVGDPAAGYEVVDRVANPATVLLDGPEATLAELVSVVTEPVDVDGATTPVSARVGLDGLPSDVRVVDPADGTVVVVVQIRQRGVTQSLPDQPVTVTGLAPGLDAVVDPATVEVVISAPEATLATLRASEVVVQVSAEGLSPGVYRLAPQVVVPSGVEWMQTTPATIGVIVRTAPATPAAVPRVAGDATAPDLAPPGSPPGATRSAASPAAPPPPPAATPPAAR